MSGSNIQNSPHELLPQEENIMITEEDVEVHKVKDVHSLKVSMLTLNRELRRASRVKPIEHNTPRESTPPQT